MDHGVLEDLPGWSLFWSDEFDGAAGSPVDPAVWRPEVGGHGWGNQELQYYTPSVENAALDGAGNLAIVRGVRSQSSVTVVSGGARTPRRG
jgi:hypothetical protein